MRELIITLLICLSIFIIPAISDTVNVYRTDSQFTSTAGLYTINWTNERFDSNSMHGTPDSNINIKSSGYYLVTGNWLIGTDIAAYSFMAFLDLNGTHIRQYVISNTNAGVVSFSEVVYLDKGSNLSISMYTFTSAKCYYVLVGQWAGQGTYYPTFTVTSINESIVSSGDSMTTDQINVIIALIAICAMFVAILGTIKIWHFIGGDG